MAENGHRRIYSAISFFCLLLILPCRSVPTNFNTSKNDNSDDNSNFDSGVKLQSFKIAPPPFAVASVCPRGALSWPSGQIRKPIRPWSRAEQTTNPPVFHVCSEHVRSQTRKGDQWIFTCPCVITCPIILFTLRSLVPASAPLILVRDFGSRFSASPSNTFRFSSPIFCST